jgi:GNAT superfamily N-acetyltransferase
MNPPTLYTPTKHAHLLPSIVSCHISCITSPPFTISTFLPPLDRSLMTEYWTRACASTANSDILSGSRWIILQLTEDEKEVAGLVMLSAAFSQAVPERGTVQKLLVNPEYRRQGVAKALMGKLEDVAREEGRLFLVSDIQSKAVVRE